MNLNKNKTCKKRTISLSIILSILAFLIIIIYIFYKLFPVLKSTGRFECKIAYVLVSPLGFITSAFAVVETAYKWLPLIILAADISSQAISAYLNARSEAKNLQYIYERECVDKPPSTRAIFAENLKNAYGSNKIYLYQSLFRQYPKVGGLNIDITTTVASLQRGILNTLCPTALEKYIITVSDMNIEKCIRDIYEDIVTEESKKIAEEFFKKNPNLTCLMYILSNYVKKTYLESLKLSVKLGEGRMHYAFFVNYTLNDVVYLSDLLVFLDLIEFEKDKEIKSIYKEIYGNNKQVCTKEGQFYREYKNIKELCDQNDGIMKIIVFSTYLGTPDKHSNEIIFDTPGVYRVNIGYDGQGSLLIVSVRFNV